MNKLKLIVTSVLMMAMLFVFSKANVLATDDYTYTVTFYAGNQGSFQGTTGLSVSSTGAVQINHSSEKVVITGLHQGDLLSFDVLQGAVSLFDMSKYYIKGVRLSGRDNDTVSSAAFSVTGDADYVVAYGIKGNLVDYTVQYQTASGQDLIPSRTYFGNIGDKPVVAYVYIENYLPQALALTRTLSANPVDNVFTFVYAPIGTSGVTEVEAGTSEISTTGSAGTGNGVARTRGTTVTTGTDGTTTTTEGVIPDTTLEESGVEELVELEDDEVPLADATDVEDGKRSLPFVSLIMIAIIGMLGIAIIVALIKKNKQENMGK